MVEKRRGLGRGIEALIPSGRSADRPSDIFFPREGGDDGTTPSVRGSVRGTETTNAGKISPKTSKNSARSTPGITNETSKTKSNSEKRNKETGETAQKPSEPNADGLIPVPGLKIADLPIGDISPNTRQPREVFDEDDLEELSASIREVGLLQPIVVREANSQVLDTPYELIMGERRWRACKLAGKSTIPAIIRSTDDDDLLRDALLENLHRANLNPLEEASAYRQLLEDFDCTHDELARRIARSRPQISNTLRLLKLPPLVQRRVAAGVLSAGHARALLGLPDAAAMERLAQRIVAEGLSVRATEEIIALGEEPLRPERRRRHIPNAAEPALQELATRLADRFDTKVKVAMGQRKGRITVEFAGLEDLDRILQVMAPGAERPEIATSEDWDS